MAVEVAAGRPAETDEEVDRAFAEAEERERAGIPLTVPGEDRSRRSGVILDKEPFKKLIKLLIAQEDAEGHSDSLARVARRLGVATKAVESYLVGKTVDENTVEMVLRALGSRMVHDLYPEGPEVDYVGAIDEGRGSRVIPRRRRPVYCASPGCERQRKRESSFCRHHAELLERIKAELDGKANKFRERIRRADARPSCTAPGCWMPRTPPSVYCAACQEDYGEPEVIEA